MFLGILAFCIYANTLKNGYVFDDWITIQYNSIVKKGISAIPEILNTPYHYGYFRTEQHSPIVDDLYRPLSLVVFAVEFQLFPNNPLPAHFVNILLYVGCVILLFYFLYHLFKKKRPFIAFAAAFLFTIHPIHTEVVANIKSTDELLCFMFAMVSLNTFLRFINTNKIKFLFYGLFFYFISLLAKETSITFLALYPLIFFLYRNENKRASTYISITPLLVTVLYLAIRFYVLVSHHAYNPSRVLFEDNALAGAPSAVFKLATAILILGSYLKLLIVPYPLICDYSFNAIHFVNFTNIAFLATIVVYIFLIVLGITKLRKKQDSPLTFGIIFYIITLSIFSNILMLIGAAMAERFLFFPSAGFCVIVAAIIEEVLFKTEISDFTFLQNKKILYLLGIVAFIHIAITIDRNGDWKDNITLYETDSKKSPDNYRLYYFLGAQQELERKNVFNQAENNNLLREVIQNLQKSISIYSYDGRCQNQLSVVFLRVLQLDSAEAHSKIALKYCPEKDMPLNTLANIQMVKHNYVYAAGLLRQANDINPVNADYLYNLGLCFALSNQIDSSIYYFKKSIKVNSEIQPAIQLLAYVYKINGRIDSARQYESLARQYFPDFNIEKVRLPNCGFYE